MWNTKDPMVGEKVYIQTCYGEEETAVVLAVSTINANLRVRSEEDGEILIGNQWEPAT